MFAEIVVRKLLCLFRILWEITWNKRRLNLETGLSQLWKFLKITLLFVPLAALENQIGYLKLKAEICQSARILLFLSGEFLY